ncbi:unnamed protein product [Arabidopsis lyrata]|uniref:Expressed protein n=1 Tax=Arabidopsis lyrata subsp. lyrata TaxID=81972 RepID=D7KXC0_ARALL|nr:expressed protein [Arabidopsis lyrata subsp. lyrata]CAH8256397.1 unnamed protein product [Arabidopsis lyrata]
MPTNRYTDEARFAAETEGYTKSGRLTCLHWWCSQIHKEWIKHERLLRMVIYGFIRAYRGDTRLVLGCTLSISAILIAGDLPNSLLIGTLIFSRALPRFLVPQGTTAFLGSQGTTAFLGSQGTTELQRDLSSSF